MTPRFVWTPALDARLAELHATGMKFKQIAFTLNQEFKVSLTRNAAIGRAHRNVLALRLPPKRSARPKRSKSKPKPKPKPKPIAEAPPIAPPEPVPGALLMRHLTRFTCHWPTGDKPPYTYCGKPTVDGGSFCATHYALAYVKPRKEFI